MIFAKRTHYSSLRFFFSDSFLLLVSVICGPAIASSSEVRGGPFHRHLEKESSAEKTASHCSLSNAFTLQISSK